MDWVIVAGGISGIVALLSVAFIIGRYAGRVDDLYQMKTAISGSIVKIDTLWKVYIEDNLMRHSNPGYVLLPDELKDDIRALLSSDSHLGQVTEPTLLVINHLGLDKFSRVARSNGLSLGQVLAEANSFVFECLEDKQGG